MRKPITPLGFVLLSAAVVCSAPTATAAEAAGLSKDGPAVVSLDNGTTSQARIWQVEPGKYRMVVALGNRLAFYWVTSENVTPPTPPVPPTPNPPDPPKPDPPTPPVPVTTGLIVVVVEETASRTASQQQALGASAAYAKAKGYPWRFLDKDTVDEAGKVPASLKAFLDLAAGKPLPYLIITDGGRKLLWEGTLPPKSEAVALLQKFGG